MHSLNFNSIEKRFHTKEFYALVVRCKINITLLYIFFPVSSSIKYVKLILKHSVHNCVEYYKLILQKEASNI